MITEGSLPITITFDKPNLDIMSEKEKQNAIELSYHDAVLVFSAYTVCRIPIRAIGITSSDSFLPFELDLSHGPNADYFTIPTKIEIIVNTYSDYFCYILGTNSN